MIIIIIIMIIIIIIIIINSNKITKGKYSKKENKVNLKLKKNIQMEISVF